jgi:small subunit ribosomal protein S11
MAKAASAAGDKKGKTKKFKKKERKHIPHGLVHVQASFNNTIVTISDPNGNTVSWKSSGSLGFRGSRKGTPFAAQQAAMNAANQARDHGMRSVDVRVSGPGSGRESAVRALSAAGLDVRTIRDVTPVPHNGCRPPKTKKGVGLAISNWLEKAVGAGVDSETWVDASNINPLTTGNR